MKTKDLTLTIEVEQTPQEGYNAINNVRGWGSDTIEGNSHQLNDEFDYRHKDLHYSKQKLIEMIPGKKITWLVEEGWLSFVNKKDEWVGTKIIFEISQKGNKTLIHFTHQGLVPACECFDACTNGWSYYLLESLAPLITTGSGQPDKKEVQQVAL